ncbi:unnamed protein product [Bursaphelenchus xylophilus]|uniref:(pine wood nematode) hypothetical protein n=1 Tax=Bursaphelenchus xylophilus TaxID=6326 RepID=A0A1I7SCF7_BURXY|nr:unnamed protein product [Bursaphelenchus xylophilus]CAG9094201.1 unnamed protein product [Bursaphelenchus xylophilus]
MKKKTNNVLTLLWTVFAVPQLVLAYPTTTCTSRPCKHGYCIDELYGYSCSCFVGYVGQNCDIKVTNCELPCENGGTCANSTHCTCPNSHFGQFCQHERPDPCQNQPCGANGYCQSNQKYNGYFCKCKPDWGGRHCEIPNCTADDCEMHISRCSSDSCLNQGECVDEFSTNSTRCVCPIDFRGEKCEFKKTGELAASSGTTGNVVVVLVGNLSSVQYHSNLIVEALNGEMGAHVEFEKTDDGRSMLYKWDSINGKGDLIETLGQNQGEDVYQRRFGQVLQGILMVLRVNTERCIEIKRIEPNSTCPETVIDVASLLVSPRTQKVLEPLGLHIHSAAESRNSSNNLNRFSSLVIAGSIVASLLIVITIVLAVLTNKNKQYWYQGCHGGDWENGSLIGAALSKSDSLAKVTTGPIWIPPKERTENLHGHCSCQLTLNPTKGNIEKHVENCQFSIGGRGILKKAFKEIASKKSAEYREKTGIQINFDDSAVEKVSQCVTDTMKTRWFPDLQRFAGHAGRSKPNLNDATMLFNRNEGISNRVNQLFDEMGTDALDEVNTLDEFDTGIKDEPTSTEFLTPNPLKRTYNEVKMESDSREMPRFASNDLDLVPVNGQPNKFLQKSTGATVIIPKNNKVYPTGKLPIYSGLPGKAMCETMDMMLSSRPELRPSPFDKMQPHEALSVSNLQKIIGNQRKNDSEISSNHGEYQPDEIKPENDTGSLSEPPILTPEGSFDFTQDESNLEIEEPRDLSPSERCFKDEFQFFEVRLD